MGQNNCFFGQLKAFATRMKRIFPRDGTAALGMKRVLSAIEEVSAKKYGSLGVWE